MEVAAADDSKQTGFNGPNRPYYIAVIVVLQVRVLESRLMGANGLVMIAAPTRPA